MIRSNTEFFSLVDGLVELLHRRNETDLGNRLAQAMQVSTVPGEVFEAVLATLDEVKKSRAYSDATLRVLVDELALSGEEALSPHGAS